LIHHLHHFDRATPKPISTRAPPDRPSACGSAPRSTDAVPSMHPPALPALIVSHATCMHGSCIRTIISTHASKWHLFILDMSATVRTIQLLTVLYTEAGTEGRRACIFVRSCTALASCGLGLVLPCRSCFVGSCPAHGTTVQPCLSNGTTVIQSATLWSCTGRYSHSKVCFENKKMIRVL
jgi:hypothetical protein